VQSLIFYLSAFVLLAITSIYSLTVYNCLIVPRLSNWHSVPLYWWAIKLFPSAFARIYLFYKTKSRSEFWGIAFIITLETLIYDLIITHLNMPGTHKSYAHESPAFYFTEGAATILVNNLLIFGLPAFSLKKIIKKYHNINQGTP